MSVLDGKTLITLSSVTYNVQVPPHGEAPFSQNAAFLTALANAAGASTGALTTSVSTLSANAVTLSATVSALSTASVGIVTVSVTTSFTTTTLPNRSRLLIKGTTASQTYTLPPLASGQVYTVVNNCTSTASVITPSGAILGTNIAGSALTGTTRVLSASGGAIEVFSDGTNCFITSLVGVVT